MSSEQYICENTVFEDDTCTIYNGARVLNAHVGRHVVIGDDSYVSKCVLGDYVQINRRNQIDDAVFGLRSHTGANTKLSHVEIGKYTSISWNVSLGGNGRHHYDRLSIHPFPQLKQFGIVEENAPVSFPRTHIGNDVWIGMNCAIIAGVTIGSGAVIGAGSIVTKDIPPYAIAYGDPAVVSKSRFTDDVIGKLLEIRWWDWPDELIRKNLDLFGGTFAAEDLERLSLIAQSLKDE